MFEQCANHNRFKESVEHFCSSDPHLMSLAKLRYQYTYRWWKNVALNIPGIYILTGGRQIGKSSSCKQLIKYALEKKIFNPDEILYLPCDEIFDAKELSRVLRLFLDSVTNKNFLLIIDEITYVAHWERVIKALEDEGSFIRGIGILTGSDSLILQKAAMSFPGRRGQADQVDFHLYPLSFSEYVDLVRSATPSTTQFLSSLFQNYLVTGGYLRAINDFAEYGRITPATFLTYEQWIRGDFLKHRKQENYLLNILAALIQLGVSPISYSALTQKIGLMSKETCMDYLRLLERMDVVFNLQSFDQNKKQGFPKKDRKFHFLDPFIHHTVCQWLRREGYMQAFDDQPALVEACIASHCYRKGKAYYFKGQGEVDVLWLMKNSLTAIEVKWANQLRSADLKSLRQFKNALILGKNAEKGEIENIQVISVHDFLVTI